MKFTNIAELQDFVVWAKGQGISSFSIGEVVINFNPYPMPMPEETQPIGAEFDQPEPHTSTVQSPLEQIDPSDLFYSAGG